MIVTEHPGLHLVWYYDTIFLKPIPPYLLSRAFWEYIQEADKEVWKAAGFVPGSSSLENSVRSVDFMASRGSLR